jgi:hypothetical protein
VSIPWRPATRRRRGARLHARFGPRATLLDRYALEADARGIRTDALDEGTRSLLTLEVFRAHGPGFEVVAGSDRSVPDPIEVVDYDSAWPRRYEGWRAVLAEHLGEMALRIDQCGIHSRAGAGRQAGDRRPGQRP